VVLRENGLPCTIGALFKGLKEKELKITGFALGITAKKAIIGVFEKNKR